MDHVPVSGSQVLADVRDAKLQRRFGGRLDVLITNASA